MLDYKVLMRVALDFRHVATGKTRHFRDGRMLGPPSELQIVSYAGDAGYYLVYLDKTGAELTDTYHDTREAALRQAAWEFDVLAHEWEHIGDD